MMTSIEEYNRRIKRVLISEEEIKKLADTFEAFQNGTLEAVKGFCSIASLEDIAKQIELKYKMLSEIK